MMTPLKALFSAASLTLVTGGPAAAAPEPTPNPDFTEGGSIPELPEK